MGADPRVTPDCDACAALCCIALDLIKGARFAIDKPAGAPCPNLTATHRCRLHKTLAEDGYPGCAAYDCLGAGQRVTRDLFGGRSWRDEPSLARPMIEAFHRLRRVQETLELLLTAGTLPLSPEKQARRQVLVDRLSPDTWSHEALAALSEDGTLSEAQVFLTSLAEAAGSDRRLRRAAVHPRSVARGE